MEKIKSFQTKIEFPEEGVGFAKPKIEENKENTEEKNKLVEGVHSLVEEYCKKENKKISFNAQTVLNCYQKAFNECKKEKDIKANNPSYQRTLWKTIMMNHRPDFFNPNDWLEFVGIYHKNLSRIIVDYQKI